MSMHIKKMACIILISGYCAVSLAQGQDVIVNNNNNNSGQSPYPTSSCIPQNQNDIYDSRVAPAGTYKINHGDGSSEMLYTTGEKKPYIVDNNCSNNSVAPIQPYAVVGPRR